MEFPIQCELKYSNPSGNVIASGYYRSWMTQKVANNFPAWMDIRQKPTSVGQQLISPFAATFDSIEKDLEYVLNSKYINTAPISEIDVIYRAPIPSNIDILDPDVKIRCVAAPSGCSPSGVDQIELREITSLEEFYYNVLPTRGEVISSGVYSSSVDGFTWNVKPSGILDRRQKKSDVWRIDHDLTWCYDNGSMLKQDRETMETYESYALNGSGTLLDMAYDNGFLWWVGKADNGYFLNLTSTKTQVPVDDTLDLISVINLTDAFQYSEPSGIIVDMERGIWVCDTNKTSVFEVHPCYDYFTVDKTKGYLYFREDYTDSGVFISNL